MNNIFNIDFSKFIELNLPISLRRPRLIQWLNVLFAPIKSVYTDFLVFKDSVLYILGHNSTITLLQKMLNDKFDDEARRIYILNVQRTDISRFYYLEEQKELGFYDEGSVKKGFYYIFNDNDGSSDYIIHIPIEYQPDNESDLNNYLVRVRAEVNRYNHYAKTYKIEWIN